MELQNIAEVVEEQLKKSFDAVKSKDPEEEDIFSGILYDNNGFARVQHLVKITSTNVIERIHEALRKTKLV